MDKFPELKCYGKLTIGDKIIPFENKVNSWFLQAPNYFLDVNGLTKQSTSPSTNNRTADKFSLVQETVDNNMRKIYTEMGIILLSAFNCVQVSAHKTTVRGAGTIQRDGVIRGGGFNIATYIPRTVRPYINFEARRSELNIPTGTYSLPQRTDWVYHAGNKALYCFTNPNIYKIEYDIDTGLWGSLSTVSTNWGVRLSSGFDCTDFKNRRFMQISATSFLIWDFETETATARLLNASVSGTEFGIAWDFEAELIRSVYFGAFVNSVQRSGLTIELNGNVTPNTGSYSVDSGSSTNRAIAFLQEYWLSEFYIMQYGTASDVSIAQYQYNYFSFHRGLSFFDDENIVVYATFDATNPSKVTFDMYGLPETSQTILPFEQTQVAIGDPFSIEYTYEVIDGRS